MMIPGNPIPTLPAYEAKNGDLHIWCCFCDHWHTHGRGFGHRVAHCTNARSPYHRTGYELRLAGFWQGEKRTPRLNVPINARMNTKVKGARRERLPLGTSYPNVVAHVKPLLSNPPLHAAEVRLVVDATGCGRPVLDMIRAALPPNPKPSFHLRHIQRFKLGTSYPLIVNEVKALTETAPLQGHCTLVIDQTGCGRPVYDLFVTARLSCPLYGVSIHGGDNTTHEGRQWKVPKRNLVATIQVLLQEQRLKIADLLPEAPILLKELLNFRVTIDPATAHESFTAWRESDDDDLVLATALACWIADHQLIVRSLF